MSEIRTLGDVIEQLGPRLQLSCLTQQPPPTPLLTGDSGVSGQSLVGSLDCIHPNRLQVIGQAEQTYLADLGGAAYLETIERLFAAKPAAVIFTSGIEPESIFFSWSQRTSIPLLGSALSDEEIIDQLRYFLARRCTKRTSLHGVFLEVLGMGLLLTGNAAIGKSELALELISRGHRLIADDAPEFTRIAPETVEGSCPPLLKDLLEVRGLGILDIRAMFGESAVLEAKDLRLIVDLRTLDATELSSIDRLSGALSSRRVLDVAVPVITIPVAPGRNLAILVETAVRNQVLRNRGYDAGADFMERQADAMRRIPKGILVE